MTNATTVTETDGHRLTIMAIAQCLRIDGAMGDRTTPKVLADQDSDSPSGTKAEVTHYLGIETLGVGADHPNEVISPPDRTQIIRRRFVASVVDRNMRTLTIAQ